MEKKKDVIAGDIEERHIQSNCVVWSFADSVANFSYNPYGGAVTYRASSLNWVFTVGKAHSIECARKIVRHLCARDTITAWVEPTDAQLDRGHQGHYETLSTPTWTEETRCWVFPGRLTDDRHFCQCGQCPMPESFRFTEYPCSVWCTAYYLAESAGGQPAELRTYKLRIDGVVIEVEAFDIINAFKVARKLYPKAVVVSDTAV